MNFKRKVIVTIGVVIFALTTLITTTFAWFSIAQSATVGDLELSVTNNKELLVSFDNEHYYNSLTPELFGDYIKDVRLKDVSTNDLKKFTNSYEGDEAVPNEDYLTFTLYFRCDNVEMNGLYLIDNKVPDSRYNYEIASENKITGTYAFSKGVIFRTPVEFQLTETEKMLKGQQGTFYAHDAVRFGFKELNFDDEDTRDEAELATLIFDPSNNPDRGFGVEYGALDYIKKIKDAYIVAPNETPDTVYELTTFQYGYNARNNNSLCATFQERTVGERSYYFAKVQVSIWLEGWDADCFDSIYDDILMIQFYFRSAIKAA